MEEYNHFLSEFFVVKQVQANTQSIFHDFFLILILIHQFKKK